MLINITVSINKIHKSHDLIYAANTHGFVNIVMVIKHFYVAYELFMLLKKYEYFMDKNMFWFT